MPKSNEKTPVQQAILDLRKRFGWSQGKLAQRLGRSYVSICRWETRHAPTGLSLLQLADLACEWDATEQAAIFQKAIREQTPESERYGNLIALARMDRERAASVEEALRNLFDNTDIPEIKREYRKVLRVLAQAHAELCDFADQGFETTDSRYFDDIQSNLEWQVEHEKHKKSKEANTKTVR